MSDQDWKCVPLTDLVDINPESLSNSTPAGSRFRYIDISSVQAGVIDWQTVLECSFATAPSRARRIVRPKDSLFCTVRPSLQAHAYAAWNDQDGYVCSTGFAVLRPSRSDPRFIFHKLFSEELARQVRQSEVGSSYPAVSEGELGRMFVSVPLTIEEQTRIADILDTLDEAIREAEAVIAKLRQVKAGLLHDLLTRGLDEHGHLRDPIRHPDQFQNSPLGLIPKAWKILQVGDACTSVVDCPHTTPQFRNEGVLVARTMHVKQGRFDETSASRVSEVEYAERITRLEPQPGDVIFTREAPVGEAFVIPEGMRICLGQRVMLLRPNKALLDADYLVAQIYSGIVSQKIRLLTGGTTNPHLNVAEVRRLELPLPSVNEQKAIVQSLVGTDTRLDAEQQSLSKLQSLKRGLSHDLLSGRKRVNT